MSQLETYPYALVKKYDSFEIRRYEASLFTAVHLPTDSYREASRKGFSLLAGYIFGGNERNEKIAMTTPVAMSLEEEMTIMFLVPRKFKKGDLPQPRQAQIEFLEEPARTVAAIRFGGWANDQKIEKYKNRLMAALEAEGIAYTQRFYFLGYNPPYHIFNRRNEVIVELD
ncbi:MAG TPA: heme-binding protein [Saprospiraceae bacterium]|nr:heme-binding protein [Saprospiraceae bacterium]